MIVFSIVIYDFQIFIFIFIEFSIHNVPCFSVKSAFSNKFIDSFLLIKLIKQLRVAEN